MEIIIFFLLYTYQLIAAATVYNPPLLDSKIINGSSLTTKSSLAVVSFKHNDDHSCSGVFSSANLITTSRGCGTELKEYLKERDSLTTANFGETKRVVADVELVKISDDELSDIAIVKVGEIIYGTDLITFMLYLCVITVPPSELQMFGWGFQNAPMIRDVLLRVMEITVIHLDLNECDGKFTREIKNDHYACGRIKYDHQRLDEKDIGSPLVSGNKLLGMVSSEISVSGKYFYFMPSINIINILKATRPSYGIDIVDS